MSLPKKIKVVRKDYLSILPFDNFDWSIRPRLSVQSQQNSKRPLFGRTCVMARQSTFISCQGISEAQRVEIDGNGLSSGSRLDIHGETVSPKVAYVRNDVSLLTWCPILMSLFATVYRIWRNRLAIWNEGLRKLFLEMVAHGLLCGR